MAAKAIKDSIENRPERERETPSNLNRLWDSDEWEEEVVVKMMVMLSIRYCGVGKKFYWYYPQH